MNILLVRALKGESFVVPGTMVKAVSLRFDEATLFAIRGTWELNLDGFTYTGTFHVMPQNRTINVDCVRPPHVRSAKRFMTEYLKVELLLDRVPA